MEYNVNDTTLSYQPVGEFRWGDDRVLLDQAIDLTAQTSWAKSGFTIAELFPSSSYEKFKKGVHDLLTQQWRLAGLNVPANFCLNQYHTLANNFEKHLAAIEKTKLLSVEILPLGIALLEERISELCGVALKAKNPFDNQTVFHFRVIRPNSVDNNPLHRDVWLEDYKDCINLYIPITGSDERSSLIILPESHRWPESSIQRTVDGATINGVKFNVPAVTAIAINYSVVRPAPRENEVLVFSPYLIHGGAVNLNADKTRISIELRLWRK
jgi:hypothetical protein